MHHAIVHHLLTDAQLVPELQLPPSSQLPPVLLFSMTSYDMEHPFGQSESAVLAMTLHSFLCSPSLLAGRAV